MYFFFFNPFCVEVKKQLQSIRNQIEKLTSEIPITDSLSQINQQLDSVTTTVEEYLPDAQMINRYRWIAAAVLCCFILLIVVCNYLGLVMGSLGHKSNVDPTKRGCLSNSGGNFFMAGTGFSFIFSWLLMILVCLTFVVGGNIYSLVCKSWENQELSKVEKNFTKTDLQVLANELDQLANTQESEAFLNCQLNYFQLYVDWAKKTLTEDIGRCKPAANSIDAAYVISCVYFVDSLNAFWFSLGWCTIFLIPSIILSVKLAKFYRRMKCADVYE
nr:PREDICTED: prominin-1-A-like [Latimeria chalumnae]|eukprot:XP_014353966.1 PREDICTED: prominin-1-A-like [Latimeria chalumnae]